MFSDPNGRNANPHRLAQGSTPNSQTPARKDPWMQARKVLFQKVKLRTTTGYRRIRRLDAFLENLALAAAQGNLPAMREQTWLIGFLDKKKILTGPKPRTEGSLDIERRIDLQRRCVDFGLNLRAKLFVLLRQLFKDRYELKYGDLPEFYSIVPDYVEVERCVAFILEIRKARRKADPSSDVGYGKPPVATRWKQKQSGNPSGKRKPQNDAWEAFRAAMHRAVPVIQEGRKTSTTSVAVACARLFEQAFKGNAMARRQVRTLLVQLDERGLLVPPRPRVRRKRRPAGMEPDSRAAAVYVECVVTMLHYLKRDMHEAYTRAYGPIDDFETPLEQEGRARLEELTARNLLAQEAA